MIIYRCNICGKTVLVLEDSSPDPVCCGEDMEMLFPGTGDGSGEKHVPVIERDGDLVRVKVGSEPHPMQRSHYIQWIALLTDKGLYMKEPGYDGPPEALFRAAPGEEILSAWEYCSLHGLWKTDNA